MTPEGYVYIITKEKDRLTEYNGQAITYDRIGNPLTYRDGMTMTWKRGRQLTTLQTAENSIQYKYNSDSIRTSKIVDGVVHTYEYLDGLLMHETRGEQAYDYYYDANGQLYAVSYKLSENDTQKVYYFTHNWRGDIVGIYNGNGDLKATYSYDSWGNVTAIEDANGNAITSATHIANLNPFRYRGYYQDSETGLYYVLNRYYDSVTHRFVNADSIDILKEDPEKLTNKNLFAYCDNNPLVREDIGGEFWVTVGIMAVGGLIGAGISAASSIIIQQTLTGTVNRKSVAVSAGTGFISGAIGASPLGVLGQTFAGGVIGGVSYVADCYVNDIPVEYDMLGFSAAVGAGSGYMGGAGANNGKVLTNASNSAKKTIARELKTPNQKYAQKVITSTKNSLRNTYAVSAWGASSKFAFGCGMSGVLTTGYTNVIKGYYPQQPPFLRR